MDTRTLTLSLLMAQIALMIAWLIYWRTRKVYRGFGFWTAANVLLTIGLLLLSLRDYVSDFISVIIANLFLIFSALFIFVGIRQFWGKPYHDLLNYAQIIFLVVAFPYFLYVRNDVNVRILIYSFCAGTIYLKSAINFLFDVPKELRPSSWYAGGVLAVLCVLFGIRSVSVVLRPLPNDLFAPDPVQAIFFSGTILVAIAWTGGIFLLTGRRAELEFGATQIELHRLASTDFLTGAYNRRAFFELSQREYSRARRYHRPLALLIFDIDRFKQVNDAHGHLVGDEVLKGLVHACRSVLRETDILARMGGEEFAILLPETDLEGGFQVAEKLRRTIFDLAAPFGDASVKISISVGVARLHAEDQNLDALVRRADAALYNAKRSGRNRVVREFPLGPALDVSPI